MNFGDMDMPERLRATMKNRFKREDSYENFMEMCTNKGSFSNKIKMSELLDVYIQWYRINVCNSPLTLNHSRFKAELKRLGYEVKAGTGNANLF